MTNSIDGTFIACCDGIKRRLMGPDSDRDSGRVFVPSPTGEVSLYLEVGEFIPVRFCPFCGKSFDVRHSLKEVKAD